MTKKSTKRALLTSVAIIALCLVMLMGITFAWFTDTASTGVNKITAGNLHVKIIGETADTEIATLDWVNEKGEKLDNILWEPGCTYLLAPFRIKNTGNLALKYKMEITGLDGESKLLDVIHFTCENVAEKEFDVGKEYTLEPNTVSGVIKIKAHMDEAAGNEYQGLELEGVKITVQATQAASEYDSFNNTYDEKATYASPVSTVDELEAAVANGENVVLQNDLTLAEALSVSGEKEVSIDLNGHSVTAAKEFVVAQDGAKVTLTGGTVEAGKGVVFAKNTNTKVIVAGGKYTTTGGSIALYVEDGAELTVNGGEFTSNEFTASAQKGGTLVINGGTFTAKDNAVVATNGSNGYGNNTITINGGTFNGYIQSSGYIACGVYVANNDNVTINGGTFNVTDGVGVLMRAGNTTIGKGVTINLTNTGKITEGKVGDAKINISTPSYLVQDVRSGYPGATAGFTITNNSGYELVTLDK